MKTLVMDFQIRTIKRITIDLNEKNLKAINDSIAEGLENISVNGELIRPLTADEIETIMSNNEFENQEQIDYFDTKVTDRGYGSLYYTIQDYLSDFLWDLEDSSYCETLDDEVDYNEIEFEDDEEDEPTYNC